MDYQMLGMSLYFLWHDGRQAGLGSSDIERIQRSLGLESEGEGSGIVQSFHDIFTHPIIAALQPDQIAQVAWLINTGGQQHAFLIGRLQSREWFLYDQGPDPAVEFHAFSLFDLYNQVDSAASSGRYWLFYGSSADYMRRGGLIPGWTGVMLLRSRSSIGNQARNIVPPGAFLAEIDEGYFTIGNRLTRGRYVSQQYDLAAAQSDFDSSTPGGGLIIEMPHGVFTLYTTSPVSRANLFETTLDSADSSGGVLTGNRFIHAWLKLGTKYSIHGSWFQVY